MPNVEELIVKLKGLPAFLQTAGNIAIYKESQDIVDMNKQQLLSGFDADGAPLGEYSPTSIEIRQKKGLQTDHIDLRYSGRFQASFVIERRGNIFDLEALDPKWIDKLEPRWPDALGLTKANEDKLTELLSQQISDQLNKYFA